MNDKNLFKTRTVFNEDYFNIGDFVKVTTSLNREDLEGETGICSNIIDFGFIKKISEEGIDIILGTGAITEREVGRLKYIPIENMFKDNMKIKIEKIDLKIFDK